MTTTRYRPTMATAGHLGMLIIRVWREDTGDPDALRARLTESIDIESGERTIATTASVAPDGTVPVSRNVVTTEVRDDVV